jgi:hypothetical protein
MIVMKKQKTMSDPKNSDYFSSMKNSGLKVNHAKAGKKIIGTASPGNSSGLLTDKGREIDIGIITAAKERIDIRRWKIKTLFFLGLLLKKKYEILIIRQTIRFRLIIVPRLMIFEKSACVAK